MRSWSSPRSSEIQPTRAEATETVDARCTVIAAVPLCQPETRLALNQIMRYSSPCTVSRTIHPTRRLTPQLMREPRRGRYSERSAPMQVGEGGSKCFLPSQAEGERSAELGWVQTEGEGKSTARSREISSIRQSQSLCTPVNCTPSTLSFIKLGAKRAVDRFYQYSLPPPQRCRRGGETVGNQANITSFLRGTLRREGCPHWLSSPRPSSAETSDEGEGEPICKPSSR